jgi:hypothetical protein
MEALRDRYGQIIGKIEIQQDGRHILRDKYGRRLAQYDPHENITRDQYGRRVGVGNLLAGFLEESG